MENLSDERTADLLINGKVGHIGVIDGDVPYVSPVSYVVIDNEVCFRTGTGRRVEAIRANPAVSFEVMRTTADGGWECVVADGQAREVDDDIFAQNVVSALLSKYREELGSPFSRGKRTPISEPATYVAVSIDELTGRTSGTWISIPSRPGRL
jgi:nitroimidazol reductase NimA-like FMN-containing flavoprotein (pyridoxamine 5'-phosphate oxidase superfamily)